MSSLNQVQLIGRLGKDPESRSFQDGTSVCNFSLATTEKWKDKTTGETREATEWHRISAYGKLAEICQQYLQKGSTIFVQGSLHTKEWTDKDGVKRYTTEIRADMMKMLGAKPEGEGKPAAANAPAAPKRQAARQEQYEDPLDENVPF